MALHQAVNAIRESLRRLGYRAASVVADYEFAALAGDRMLSRKVSLAAFTDTPLSYRTAAFGVLIGGGDARELIIQHRDLGAPHWFRIQDSAVEAWSLRGDNRVEKIAVRQIPDLPKLFESNRLEWSPDSVHRAKLVPPPPQATQLHLNGLPLVTAIESRVCRALDGLVGEAIQQMCQLGKFTEKQLALPMKLAFAMIASKVLMDRGNPVAAKWEDGTFADALEGITSHYGLSYLEAPKAPHQRAAAEEAWSKFKNTVNLRNVSAEDLAFVYENTLVTPESRIKFGSHSTPRAVAEYVIGQLRLEDYELSDLRVFEPFCGASSLLVAAAKRMRALLPSDWSDSKRHNFLVSRLRGADIDLFATQVSSLSLILADYPNKNGWDIRALDLLSDDTLEKATPDGVVAVCNPPFADFSHDERSTYKKMSDVSVHKPVAALRTILKRNPIALGWVMPHGMSIDRTYSDLRAEIAAKFDEVEIVSLPDRVFEFSTVESSLLIARRKPEPKQMPRILVRSLSVHDVDRQAFLDHGKVPAARQDWMDRTSTSTGNLWLPELVEVWRYLAKCRKLNEVVDLHRGIEWKSGHQDKAWSPTKGTDRFRRGFHNVEGDLSQFAAPVSVYLDCRSDFLRGNAIEWPWEEPKILFNAARMSRGPWRIAAWIDRKKNVASQQFVGAWLKKDADLSLEALVALINSPVTSAYLFALNERKGFRLGTIGCLPLPSALDLRLIEQRVSEYLQCAERWHASLFTTEPERELVEALLAIDAAVLKAYDLPPRLERQLLDLFAGCQRPALGGLNRYFASDFKPFVSLDTYLQGWRTKTAASWFSEAFSGVPATEGTALSKLL